MQQSSAALSGETLSMADIANLKNDWQAQSPNESVAVSTM
jgi:hypothetical protein